VLGATLSYKITYKDLYTVLQMLKLL